MVTEAERNLKREIGFVGLLAMCVGINIGGALFALTGTAAGLTGPSLPLAMLISSLPILLALGPYLMFSTAWPTTSATYRYSQILSPGLAFTSLLTLAVCMCIGGQPLYALAFGTYLAQLVPVSPKLMGVIALTFFYVLNILGIKPTAWLQSLLFFVLVAALALYVALGLGHVDPARFAEPFPHGVGGLLAASGLLFTFSAGGLFVVDLGGEVAKPERSYMAALAIGIGLAVLLYMLIHVVTVGAVDWTVAAGQTLIGVAQSFMGRAALAFFIIGGALVACATTINIVFTVISRGFLVVSGEGLLPEFLGRVNKRFGTPHWGLTVAWLVTVVSLLTVPSLMFFGSMLNLGLALAITVVCLSAARVPEKAPAILEKSRIKFRPRTLKVVSYAAVALNGIILLFLSVAVGLPSLVFVGILAASYVLYRTQAPHRKPGAMATFDAGGR